MSESASFQRVRKSPYASFALTVSPARANALTQLQVCQRTNRIRADDPAMIEDLLKLGGRFRIPVRGQQSLAAHISRVQATQIT